MRAGLLSLVLRCKTPGRNNISCTTEYLPLGWFFVLYEYFKHQVELENFFIYLLSSIGLMRFTARAGRDVGVGEWR